MPKLTTTSIRITETGINKVDLIVRESLKIPRSQIRALFQHQLVSLNGTVCINPGTRVFPGDLVEIQHEPGRIYKEKPKLHENRIFRLVYEDRSVLVVEKQPGFLTSESEEQVSSDGSGETLLDAVSKYIKRGPRPLLVHRLDRDTSGLLVFAKSQPVWNILKQQFRERKPARTYHAIVRGHLTEEKGTFRSYLALDQNLSQRSVSNELGKLAITHFEVKRLLEDSTLVSVTLETGRRNQIRVHFAEAGHPILGDKRYRPILAKHPRWTSRFLALHATTLGFEHPEQKKPVFFESDIPERMKAFIENRSPKKRTLSKKQLAKSKKRKSYFRKRR